MKIKAIKVSKKELDKITVISSNDINELDILFSNKNKWILTDEPERYLELLDRFNCFYQVKYAQTKGGAE